MPAHSHGLQIWGDPNGSPDNSGQYTIKLTDRHFHFFQNWNNTSCANNNNGSDCGQPVIITPNGGNQPHNNMPPYYALAFIMKL